MLPSLIGIIASSGGAAAGGDYESIATVTVGSGGSSSISFSSIPSTYQHLQIRVLSKSSLNQDYGNVVTFNGDTGNNYVQFHQLYGSGTAAVAGVGSTSAANMEWLFMPGVNRGASTFGTYVIDVLDYANTNKNKTVRNLGGFDDNGAGFLILRSHLWMSTAAVNSITLTTPSGNFAQYSSFALYGIKG